MFSLSKALLSLSLLVGSSHGFAPQPTSVRSCASGGRCLAAATTNTPEEESSSIASRRQVLKLSTAFAASSLASVLPSGAAHAAAGGAKVLVLGGTGLVGSRVVSQLQSMGIEVVATSTNGRDGTVALNFVNDDVQGTVSKLAAGCTAVISCVGTIGTPNDQVVNSGTAIAAKAAKAAGVDRFVYITVAPQVQEMSADIDFLQDYMTGKKFSRSTVLSSFENKATLIEPTFIYGGDEFKVNPPRVAGFYGSFIEGLLSSGPIRAVEGVMPPGIVKVALEPPLAAETIAQAAVAGAVGKSDVGILDNYDKIKQAAAQI